jgi:pimeloyl-ACP methyl ester carboxylesterase
MNRSELRPHVVIVGGFLTEAWQYRPMRARLLAAGAADVTVAPIHLPDWVAIGLAGMGPLLLRGARAIRAARRQAPAPIIVVGHSLGGIIARLATCQVPLDGRVAAVADDVGCLVTLGTPHAFDPRFSWRHPAVRAVEHLDMHCSGAHFAPRMGYLTVCSTMAPPVRRAPTRNAFHLFNRLLRDLVGETPGVAGDGLVVGDRCQLDGARHLELGDVLHGVVYGPWYGDERAIERWWPVAVEEWRRALEARAAVA